MRRKSRLLALACAALVLAASPGAHARQAAAGVRPLTFSDKDEAVASLFQRSPADDPYLKRLREGYKLDEVVAGGRNDYERVRAVSRWVRSRWEHNGSNVPQKPDAISILEEAAGGKRFRCSEYAVVLAAALTSVGIPARVLGLWSEDAERRESGASHVVAEAYLADMKKWVMVDGQFDVIPTLRGRPLNAVELQRALAASAAGLGVDTFSGAKADKYFEWVGPYLFYFLTKFDARQPAAQQWPELCLMPLGAKQVTLFQRKHPIGHLVYTHSARAFYARPE
ncbi:MAG TPA: transglutaminase-like domain-containing protein [Pyrinomonadaceae bacterium]|nr:transglutaminase-like domain-containing protein [Pyrinomonadaceae bacterium]